MNQITENKNDDDYEEDGDDDKVEPEEYSQSSPKNETGACDEI